MDRFRVLRIPLGLLLIVLPGALAFWLPAHPEYWRAWDENRVVSETASGYPVEAGPMPAALTPGPSPRWVIDGATVERGPRPDGPYADEGALNLARAEGRYFDAVIARCAQLPPGEQAAFVRAAYPGRYPNPPSLYGPFIPPDRVVNIQPTYGRMTTFDAYPNAFRIRRPATFAVPGAPSAAVLNEGLFRRR